MQRVSASFESNLYTIERKITSCELNIFFHFDDTILVGWHQPRFLWKLIFLYDEPSWFQLLPNLNPDRSTSVQLYDKVLGVKIRNLKVDFKTGGTWRQSTNRLGNEH